MDIDILRQEINNRIVREDIRTAVRNIIGQKIDSTDDVLKQLKEQGVITGLLDEIQLKQPRQAVPEVKKGPSDRYVSIAFTSGRAFIRLSGK